MERFVIQKAQQVADGWVCTDTENGIVCRFKDHQFNETQQFTLLENIPQPDALAVARMMREMGDWLSEHHRDKVF